MRKAGITAAVICFLLSACHSEPVDFLTRKVDEKLFSYEISLRMENASIAEVKISDFKTEYDKNREAVAYFEEAIVNSQYINVDSYAGATKTSESIKSNLLEMLDEMKIDRDHFINKSKLDDLEVNEEVYDEVIVGAGLSGLTAAARMAQQGKNVVVVEKMPFAGGAGYLSGGEMSVPMLDKQSADPVNAFYKDMMEGSNHTGDPHKLFRIASGMDEVYTWLKEDVGIEFHEEPYEVQGHSAPRIDLPKQLGKGLIDGLVKECEKNGVTILYNVEALSLIDEEGKVTGINTLSNKNEIINIYSEDKVILATGGFAYNKILLGKYNKQWDHLDKLTTTVPEGSTGDGIIMAQNIGADVVDMDKIQLFPFTNPATGVNHYIEGNRTVLGAIFVNKEGERFVDEHANREVLATEFLKQTDQTVYQIFNHELLLKTMSFSKARKTYEEEYDQGVLFTADTLEDLCHKAGIGQAFIEDYDCEGPYYAIVGTPSIHYTMGGLKTSLQAEVLDVHGKVIPGLYAIGETTGGTFGENRLGATSIPDGLVNGYLIAENR